MKLKKRIYGLLLVLCLTALSLPGMTFAADDEVNVSNGITITTSTTEADIAAAWGAGVAKISQEDGVYTITLLKNITMNRANKPIAIGDFDSGADQPMIVLDLNGCTVKSNTTVIANYGNLTIKDSKGGGLVLYNGGAYLCAVNNVGYTMIIDGGNFECQGAGSAEYNSTISSAWTTNTIINDGHFEGNGAGALITYGNVQINGGEFDGKYGVVSKASGAGEGEITFPEDSTAVINAEKMAFVVHKHAEKGYEGNVYARGGTFNTFNANEVVGSLRGADKKNNVEITGGTFTASPKDYVPENSPIASFTSAAGTNTSYAVGVGTIAAAATQTNAGDRIEIMQGDVELKQLDNVNVSNSGGGNVIVNGQTVSMDPVEVHTLQLVSGQKPTCTENGWKDYYQCSGADGKLFEDAAAQKVIASIEDWKANAGKLLAAGHSYNKDWTFDELEHWHECSSCKEKADVAKHTYEWVIDKEATAMEKGSKHEKCTICGREKAAVEIPAKGTIANPSETVKPSDSSSSSTDGKPSISSKPTNDSKPSDPSKSSNIPQTGDTSGFGVWLTLLMFAGIALIGMKIYSQKRRYDR